MPNNPFDFPFKNEGNNLYFGSFVKGLNFEALKNGAKPIYESFDFNLRLGITLIFLKSLKHNKLLSDLGV